MIIFRCNAGPELGFGHLVRCRALATALREEGEVCIMVGPDLIYRNENDTRLFTDWIPCEAWNSETEDASRLAELTMQRNANFLILDDYRVRENYQLVLKNNGLHWLQFAQPNQNLWADFVLNASPAAKSEQYRPYLRNPNTKLLLGLKYAILRPEFLFKKKRCAGRPVKNLLVTFGGGDDRGAIQFVLKTLMPITPEDIQFLVISGIHNPRNVELTKWVEKFGQNRVILKINPSDISAHIEDCDLAIMAGGTTTYEVAFFGMPMLLISIAENQILHSLAWEKAYAAKYLGTFNDLNADNLVNSFFKYVEKYDSLLMHHHAGIVDGHGSKRVAKSILSKGTL